MYIYMCVCVCVCVCVFQYNLTLLFKGKISALHTVVRINICEINFLYIIITTNHTQTQARTHSNTYTHTNTHIHIHSHIYSHTLTHTCVCTHINIYILNIYLKRDQVIDEDIYNKQRRTYINLDTHTHKRMSGRMHSFCIYVLCIQIHMGGPVGVMVKAMDCGIVVSEFVLESRYYVHFRANTLGKGMNPLWVK